MGLKYLNFKHLPKKRHLMSNVFEFGVKCSGAIRADSMGGGGFGMFVDVAFDSAPISLIPTCAADSRYRQLTAEL
jgi:hypothetical protein